MHAAPLQDEGSVEVLSFQLAHPLCVVREVDLRPFRAFFQWEHPIYAPKAVRFRLGGLDCFGADGASLPRATLQRAVLRMMPGGAAAGPAAALAAGGAAGEVPPQAAAGQAPALAAAAAQQGAWQPGAEGPGLGAAAGVQLGPAVVMGPAVLAGGAELQLGQQPAGIQLGPAWAAGSGLPASSGPRPDAASPLEPRQLPLSTVWESPTFTVQQADELQRFEIEPTICVGGLLQVRPPASMRPLRKCPTLLGGLSCLHSRGISWAGWQRLFVKEYSRAALSCLQEGVAAWPRQ